MPGVSPSARLSAASDNGQYLRVVSVLADELTLAVSGKIFEFDFDDVSLLAMAGAAGVEPESMVLETIVLPIKLHP